jgi:hypothetical protein
LNADKYTKLSTTHLSVANIARVPIKYFCKKNLLILKLPVSNLFYLSRLRVWVVPVFTSKSFKKEMISKIKKAIKKHNKSPRQRWRINVKYERLPDEETG